MDNLIAKNSLGMRNKTRIGLDIPVLPGLESRGIYAYFGDKWYYGDQWGIGNDVPSADIDSYAQRVLSGQQGDAAEALMGRDNGFAFGTKSYNNTIKYGEDKETHELLGVKNLAGYRSEKGASEVGNRYFRITDGDVFNDYGPKDGLRIIPFDNTGDYLPLHIQVDAAPDTNTTVYYNNDIVLTLNWNNISDKNNTVCLVTFANISFEGFRRVAKSLYAKENFPLMYENGKLTNSTPYDKYRYYWATHDKEIGRIVAYSSEGGKTYNNVGDVTGSVDFWQQFYRSGIRPSSTINYDQAIELSGATQKYVPLYQRMERAHNDQSSTIPGADDDQKSSNVVITW
jgi:hypothetical protein